MHSDYTPDSNVSFQARDSTRVALAIQTVLSDEVGGPPESRENMLANFEYLPKS